MKLLKYLILFFLIQNIFAQKPAYFYKTEEDQNINEAKLKSAQTIKEFALDIDLTPKLGEDVSQDDLKKLPYYFAVVKKNDQIDSIASYDLSHNVQNYLLDREFNLYFSIINVEYKAAGNKISRLNMYDKIGQLRAYVLYNWKTNEKNKDSYLDSVEVFAYSLIKHDLVRVESRFFKYGGSAFGKNIKTLNRGKGNLSKYSNEYFGNGNTVVSYTRYTEAGDVQYSKNLFYEEKSLTKVETYNKEGVLISTENKLSSDDDNKLLNDDNQSLETNSLLNKAKQPTP